MRKIWLSINWNGTFDNKVSNTPSDFEKVNYFRNLFKKNIGNQGPIQVEDNVQNSVYIPILDDPLTETKLDTGIKKMKSNKAAGLDGISPGVFKILNATWLLFLAFLFNTIFYATYPISWTKSKFFSIFKSDDSLDPSNYCSINIMSALPKLYDLILVVEDVRSKS